MVDSVLKHVKGSQNRIIPDKIYGSLVSGIKNKAFNSDSVKVDV